VLNPILNASQNLEGVRNSFQRKSKFVQQSEDLPEKGRILRKCLKSFRKFED